MIRQTNTAPSGTRPRPTEEGIGRGWLLAIFLAALAYRALCFWVTAEYPLCRYPVLEAKYHHDWAERIVAGDRLGHGPEDVARPPLYPYFLAAHYAVFGSYVTLAQWTQFVLGAVSCGLVAVLGGRLMGRAAGRLAGLISAIYGPYVFFESQLLTPALSLFLILAAMLLLVPPQRSELPRYRGLLAAGLLFGLSAGIRPGVILPALLMLLYLLVRNRRLPGRQLAAAAACLALGVAVVLLPITLRNYLLVRQFVPVSAHAGIDFYLGNSAGADGVTGMPVGLRRAGWFARIPQEILEKPASAGRWWARAAWHDMREAPGTALLRLGGKVVAFFNSREFRDDTCYHFIQNVSWPLRFSPFQFATVLPLTAVGLFCLWRRRNDPQRRRAFTLCVLWVAAYGAIGVVFFVTAGSRLPVVPFLILPAAWGILQITDAIQGSQWKRLVGYAALMCLVGVTCWPTWLGPPQADWAQDYVNLGNVRRSVGDPGGAQEAYAQALDQRPDDPDAHYLLGYFFLPKLPERALEHFEAAEKLLPDSPDLRLAITRVYLAVDNATLAREHLHEVLRLATTSNLWPRRAAWATAHILLAELDAADEADPKVTQAHWDEAWKIDPRTTAETLLARGESLPPNQLSRVVETFRVEVEEKPWDFSGQTDYGLALLASGKASEAVGPLRKASRLAPRRPAIRFHLARALEQSGKEREALQLARQLQSQLPAGSLRDQAKQLQDRIEAEN